MLCTEKMHISRMALTGQCIVALFREPALQPFGAILLPCLAVLRGAGDRNGGGVDVGAENLHLAIDVGRGHGLPEQDGERIDLLSGGAAGHPHADRVIGVPVLQEGGKDGRVQRVERLGIAEELRDADEQLAEQKIGFVRVGLAGARCKR